MATVNVEIDIEDVMREMSSWERRSLCKELIEDGYGDGMGDDSIDSMLNSVAERSFEGQAFAEKINDIVSKYDSLTPAQLKALMSI